MSALEIASAVFTMVYSVASVTCYLFQLHVSHTFTRTFPYIQRRVSSPPLSSPLLPLSDGSARECDGADDTSDLRGQVLDLLKRVKMLEARLSVVAQASPGSASEDRLPAGSGSGGTLRKYLGASKLLFHPSTWFKCGNSGSSASVREGSDQPVASGQTPDSVVGVLAEENVEGSAGPGQPQGSLDGGGSVQVDEPGQAAEDQRDDFAPFQGVTVVTLGGSGGPLFEERDNPWHFFYHEGN